MYKILLKTYEIYFERYYLAFEKQEIMIKIHGRDFTS